MTTCCADGTVGSDKIIEVTRGSSLDYVAVFTDEADAPEDISSDAITFSESEPAGFFTDDMLTKTDPLNGEVTVHVSAEQMAELSMAPLVNWFRITRTQPGSPSQPDASDRAWVNVI